MKLFSLRLTTLKSKLYAIVFASFVVRVVAFFVLPSTPSSLGPDEGTYGAAAEWTALSKPARDFPDFGSGLYVSGRTLLLPASAFYRIGFSAIDSVRVTASIYGLLTTILVVSVILKYAATLKHIREFCDQNPTSLIVLVLLFAFMPSNFLWSILGLRESAITFWTLCVFLTLFHIKYIQKKLNVYSGLFLFTSIILAFSARPQVGWVIGVSLVAYLLFKLGELDTYVIYLLVIGATVLGYAFTQEIQLQFKEVKYQAVLLATPTSSATPTSLEEILASKECNSVGQQVTLNNQTYECELIVEIDSNQSNSKNQLNNPATVLLEQADSIPYHHEVNKLTAASAIESQTCPRTGSTRVDKYFCIAWRAPYSTFSFLYRPIFGADVTSTPSLFASIENLFWFSASTFVIIVFIRNRRLAFFKPLMPSAIFFSIYTVAAGAYEGNLGTAFRHKSLILWVVLLLIASAIVATQQRKAGREGISGSSQE